MSTVLAVFAIFLPVARNQVIQWFVVIALNATVAIVQQARARKQLDALQKLTAARCRVLRGNAIKEIPAEMLVPGDIILLEQGDRIPADALLFKSADLHVNQSALTGEPVDVEKSEEDDSSDPTRPRNRVYLGTFVTAGSGTAIVTETGRTTELGKISSQLGAIVPEKLGLQREINKLARYLAAGVIAFLVASLTFKFALVLSGSGRLPSDPLRLTAEVVRTLVTAMSIMPINIPLLTTIVLVTGVLVMARQNVVVRDLNSIETFSQVSVLCTDKTGTLTKGEMTARWLCFPTLERAYGVTGVGFEPQGKIMESGPGTTPGKLAGMVPEELSSPADLQPESDLWYALVCAFVDNASHRVGGDSPKLVGNMTDVSLAVLFAKSGLSASECASRFPEVESFSFDSRLKRMTKVCRDVVRGNYVVFTKGATEIILPLCTSASTGSVAEKTRLDDKTRSKIAEWTEAYTARGYRVISLCCRRLSNPTEPGNRESAETDLAYLGFVAILDPPRTDVRESVLEAQRAGVKPVMITGDNAETARSIAEEVGIVQGAAGAVLTSLELRTSTDDVFLGASVFARTSPEDKVFIVKRYQRLGRSVVMTGDGVNDALALSAADIGVAMGKGGTDVAKQSADVVLADDSFTSIVQGIKQGRGIFQKIRSIVFFYIAVNLAEALVYFAAEFIPGFVLLNSWQHIFIIITAHSFPPFALIADHLNRDVMRERPKGRQGILTRRLLVALALFGVSLAGLLAFAYFGVLSGSIAGVTAENKLGYLPPALVRVPLALLAWQQAKARTMFIAVVVISECLLVLSLRRINKTIPQMLREEPRWPGWGLILLPVLAFGLLVYVPSIQTVLNPQGMNFELIRMSLGDWGIAVLLGVIPVAIVELCKLRLRSSGREF